MHFPPYAERLNEVRRFAEKRFAKPCLLCGLERPSLLHRCEPVLADVVAFRRAFRARFAR